MAAIDRMLFQVVELFSYISMEQIFMAVSYKKLWKLLIDKDMKKKQISDLQRSGKNSNISGQL